MKRIFTLDLNELRNLHEVTMHCMVLHDKLATLQTPTADQLALRQKAADLYHDVDQVLHAPIFEKATR